MTPSESKLFSTPGSFNFSMAALAADSAALAGMPRSPFNTFVYDIGICQNFQKQKLAFHFQQNLKRN